MTVEQVLTPLVQPAADAQRQLATDDGAIDGVGRAHGGVQSALHSSDADTGRRNANLSAGWSGASSDRRQEEAARISAASQRLQQYSGDVRKAVTRAAEILKVGQQTNQKLIDDFMRKAAGLLRAAAALRAAGDTAGAQQKLTELAKLGAEVSGQSGMNLDSVMGQLTGVVGELSGTSGATSPSSAGLSGAPPQSFNAAPSGGSSSTGAGGVGGAVSSGAGASTKKRLPVAIPPQPGTGVMVNLPGGGQAEAPNETAAKAVRAALGQLGVPYVWGGTSPGDGLDCSGLTQYAYGEGGLDIPRTSREQDIGAEVPSADQLLPGDLVCWDGHVAMYIGDGQIVEAGDPVQVGPLRTENAGMNFVGFYRPTG
ncbi:MAG: NlpC/P60 family protein [Pseudonocardiaceae bacterium]|nr:NlpC/P60 family protein [Pseudonocardiaceae bacterium]